MTDFNPITGEYDRRIIGTILLHIEIPLRTLVALESVVDETLSEDITAREIAKAATEDAVVDLVSSALALITASWEEAGANFKIGAEDGTPPEVDAWCESILDQAMVAARIRFYILRVEYAVVVGSIPDLKGTKS